MVTNISIPRGAEVFNTYGANLSNAQLIHRYGFMLDNNDNDVVSWDTPALSLLLISMEEDMDVDTVHDVRQKQQMFLDYLTDKWLQRPSWADSDIVVETWNTREGTLKYIINADGNVSHGLWMWAAATALAQQRNLEVGEELLQILNNMVEEQLRLEAHLTTDVDISIDDEEKPGASDSVSRSRLLDLYNVLGTVIEDHQTNLGRGKTVEEIGNLLDVGSPYMLALHAHSII